MLAAAIGDASAGGVAAVFPDGLNHENPEVRRLVQEITTTGSEVPMYIDQASGNSFGGESFWGESIFASGSDGFSTNTLESSTLIRLDDFRADPRFAGIDGSGGAAVVLDSGLDTDHPFFGPDSDGDGVADRIVYQQDFGNNDFDVNGPNAHGSNVTSIVGSQDDVHTGMAPGADLIHLKVFSDAGGGNFSMAERALQWVVANQSSFNIVSVNMSLGDQQNHTFERSLYGLGDELAALRAMGVITVSSSGNSFGSFSSRQGVGYPSADANSLSVGAVYDRTLGTISYGSAVLFQGAPDRIAPFSQRHEVLTSIMAPGAPITGAAPGGGTVEMHGTSQAAPHVAGVALLAQQLANQSLGRPLTAEEYELLIYSTGVTINDGDDEQDSVVNTGLDFQRIDVFALGEKILNMASSNIDVAGASISLSGGSFKRGASNSVSIELVNHGSEDVEGVTVDLYLGVGGRTDSRVDRLLTFDVMDLPAGARSSASLTFDLPDPNDSYWDTNTEYRLGIIVDPNDDLEEYDELNNSNTEEGVDYLNVTIPLAPINLRGMELRPADPVAVRGAEIEVLFEIENRDSTSEDPLGPSIPAKVDFYLSQDELIDPATDYLLGTADLERLESDSTTGVRSVLLELPANGDSFWTDGTEYVLGMFVDSSDTNLETDESDNLNQESFDDRAYITINLPPMTIGGIVFDDSNQDGQYASPFERTVSLVDSRAGVVSPRINTTFNFDSLPLAIGPATITVEAYGDLEELEEFATVTLDGALPTRVFDKELGTPNPVFSRMTESYEVALGEFADLVSDGVLDVEVRFTNPGSFTTSSVSWLRVTIDYMGYSKSNASVGERRIGAAHASRQTQFSFAALPSPAGDGVFSLSAVGDVGGTEETATVNLEGIWEATLLDNESFDANFSHSFDEIEIPVEILEVLLADGIIEGVLSFSGSVNQYSSNNWADFMVSYPVYSEPGVAGVSVWLDEDGDGVADLEVVTVADDLGTDVDEAGAYSFPIALEGTYRVSHRTPEGWVQTYPQAGSYDITLEPGESFGDAHFGIADVGGPKLIDVIPRRGASLVNIHGPLNLSFNEPMIKGGGSVRVMRAEDDSLFASVDISSSSVLVNGTEVEVRLPETLTAGDLFYVVMDLGALEDTEGNAYVGLQLKSDWAFTTAATSGVHGRHLYYANATGSQFGSDEENPVNAIAANKEALLPGESTSFVNYTNYIRGINGLIVDVTNVTVFQPEHLLLDVWDGLIGDPDLSFEPSGVTPALEFMRGMGKNGSDRLKITLPDNAIENTWLRISVMADASNGLQKSDVFYFGNAIADVGVGNLGQGTDDEIVRVNASDVSLVRGNQSAAPNSVGIENYFDFNKDGRVNATDTSLVRGYATSRLVMKFFTAPFESDTNDSGQSNWFLQWRIGADERLLPVGVRGEQPAVDKFELPSWHPRFLGIGQVGLDVVQGSVSAVSRMSAIEGDSQPARLNPSITSSQEKEVVDEIFEGLGFAVAEMSSF